MRIPIEHRQRLATKQRLDIRRHRTGALHAIGVHENIGGLRSAQEDSAAA